MFMVTAPSPIQHAFCAPSTSAAAAAACRALRFANECDTLARVAAEAPPQAKKLSNASTCSSGSATSLGGLRRVVSSLQAGPRAAPCALATAAAAATAAGDGDADCVVEARQVELELASRTARPFRLSVRAPNGELSPRLGFAAHGAERRFTPRRAGCGHGHWEFVVEAEGDGDAPLVRRQTFYLDGVGTLFFTVDEQLRVKLSAQQFLRLPSASQCCSRRQTTTR